MTSTDTNIVVWPNLAFLCLFIPTEKQRKVAGIVPAIEKARLYRGKGGEIMRSAVSRLIACISSSAITLNEKTRKILLDTLTDNLKHPNSHIQVFFSF